MAATRPAATLSRTDLGSRMDILALDIATVTGFAQGESGGMPMSGAVRLKRRDERAETAAFNMLAFLRDRFVLQRPDMVFAESYLNPAGHKSADAIILQIMLYGVVAAMSQAYAIRFEHAAPATIRKHFVGCANAGDRAKTKALVLRQARALRYIDHACTNDNIADAVAAWEFAAATHARRQPTSIVMFGEAVSS